MNRPLRITWIVTAILCLACSVGCTGNPNQAGELPLGQSFELRTGTSATVQGGLRITFNRVTSDSRCPMDALCVWAGDATLALSLAQAGGDSTERVLHTASSGSEVSYLAYSITLVALAPYPRSDRQIRAGDYVARLSVASR